MASASVTPQDESSHFLIAAIYVTLNAIPVIMNQITSDWISVLLTLLFISGYLYLYSKKRGRNNIKDIIRPSLDRRLRKQYHCHGMHEKRTLLLFLLIIVELTVNLF